MSHWHEALKAHGQLLADEPLARHTTLGVGGPARWYFRPENRDALIAAMKVIPGELHLMPLGRGSNLLVADSGIDGMVIDLGDLNEISRDSNTVCAGAGARMGKLAQFAAKEGLGGLEFMATIPGDVGGGIAMNAGAFGQQVSDTLAYIDIVLPGGESKRLAANELDMRYRYTQLPEGALVVSACFALEAADSEALKNRMREFREKRGATQPLAMPNCGSVFKNPEGDHAARLIEACGLKGRREGAARISDVHANFIVNEGGASSRDIVTLIRLAQTEVEKKFGIRLETEVRMTGGGNE